MRRFPIEFEAGMVVGWLMAGTFAFLIASGGIHAVMGWVFGALSILHVVAFFISERWSDGNNTD